jgi:hypothetical protein
VWIALPEKFPFFSRLPEGLGSWWEEKEKVALAAAGYQKARKQQYS